MSQRARVQVVLPYLGGVLGKEGAQAAAKGFLDRCFEASIEKVNAAPRLLLCLALRAGGAPSKARTPYLQAVLPRSKPSAGIFGGQGLCHPQTNALNCRHA